MAIATRVIEARAVSLSNLERALRMATSKFVIPSWISTRNSAAFSAVSWMSTCKKKQDSLVGQAQMKIRPLTLWRYPVPLTPPTASLTSRRILSPAFRLSIALGANTARCHIKAANTSSLKQLPQPPHDPWELSGIFLYSFLVVGKKSEINKAHALIREEGGGKRHTPRRNTFPFACLVLYVRSICLLSRLTPALIQQNNHKTLCFK